MSLNKDEEVSLPLVGEIAADFYDRLKALPLLDNKHEPQLRSRVWKELDNDHSERPDYQLLRHALGRDLTIPKDFKPASKAGAFGLEDPRPEIVWGTLSLLPTMTTSAQGVISASEAETLLAWDALSLSPLRDAPIGCDIVRLLFRAARDRVYEKQGATPLTLDEAWRLLEVTEKTLTRAAFQWQPGRAIKLNLAKLNQERRLSSGGPSDLGRRLATAVFNIRASVRDTCDAVPWSKNVDRLLRRVAPLAFSVWRTWRMMRESPPPYLIGNKRAVFVADSLRKELKALERACQAARDAGQYVTAAKLAAMLLFQIPQGQEDDYRAAANRLAHSIREHGYIIDSRFLGQQSPQTSSF